MAWRPCEYTAGAWKKDLQKCTSVLDFRRNGCSLQLRGVKWTSPQHFTHRFDSLHHGGDEVMRTCKKQRRYPLKRKPGRTRPNSDEAGATPPFDAPCVTASVGSLPPQSRAARDRFSRVPEPEFRSCKTTSITPP
jgi:hypothetical protein